MAVLHRKDQFGEGKEVQGLERFRVGVVGWVRNSERNQDSVTGICYAERSRWPVSALIC